MDRFNNCYKNQKIPIQEFSNFQSYSSNINPLISVIVAVFNGELHLQRCIDSVMNQNYSNKELIIIDGGSSDGTLNIIEKNMFNIAYWESKPDRGIYHAWNKALSHAKGDWILFLGCDDYFWGAQVLEQMVPILKEAVPKYRVVYGKVAIVGEDSDIIELYGMPWRNSRKRFLNEMCLSHQGVFHHRSLFLEKGFFDETFRIAGDYELLLRELQTRDGYFAEEVTVAGMQLGGISNSLRGAHSCLKEFKIARQKHGLKSSIYKQFVSWMNVYARQLWVTCFGKSSIISYERDITKLKRSLFKR